MGFTRFEVPSTIRSEFVPILTETATLLIGDADPQTVCQQLFERIAEPLGLDAYFHYIVTADQSHLLLASCGGVPDSALPSLLRLEFGQAVCGTAAQRCESMYLCDVDRRNDEMTALIRGFGIRCYTCQPLIIDGRLLGTFSFGSRRKSTLSDEELDLVRLICKQVTLAVARRLDSERIRQSEKLAATGRLAATIAHEINNPLEAVTNLLFLAKSHADSEGMEYVQLAEESLARIAHITKQILSFHRDTRNFEFAALTTLIDSVVAELEHVAAARRVKIVKNYAADLYAYCSPFEIKQVVANLLANALDASPEHSTVVVTAENSSGHVRISVRDTGGGVRPDLLDKIFEPFFTTKATKGTGLGLWISRQLVEKNRGTLSVSNHDAGAVFSIMLPTNGVAAGASA